MRGKDGVNDSVQAVTGITPACAGKSEKTRSITTTRRDHPRVCGEMSFAVLIVCIALGSPPRMRGKVHLTAYFFIIWGITPACAGKRMVFAGRKSRTWDHPRVCGEKPASMPRHALRRGSPPRMRGKASQYATSRPAARITPAYAGKSLWSGSVRVWVWDHPRVCGEKVAVCHDHASGVGSPPRMRGKEEGHPRSQGSQGITPAYAGKRFRLGLHTS